MAPPVFSFPTSELPVKIQGDVKGKKRKVEGGGNVDLSKCQLFKMYQYDCFIDGAEDGGPVKDGSAVRCFDVPRYFREYVPFCASPGMSFMAMEAEVL